MKKLVSLLSLVLALAMLVGVVPGLAEGEYKDTITWVIGNDQDCLDPHRCVSNSKVIPQYYDGLIGLDVNNNVVPRIAKSWEVSDDNLTWTFHLRDDVYFHSGRHCTAADFQATWERLLDAENPVRYAKNYGFVDHTEAVDDYTFKFYLKEPKAFFLTAISHRSSGVLNPEYIEKYGLKLGDTAESVDGTGPFKCTGWIKGEEMRFERFDNYYGDKAATKEIVMKIVPEQNSRAIAIETHQADIVDGISPDDAVRLATVPGVKVSLTPGVGCHLFQFNCKSDKAPIADPKVRQAISYAIDRYAICEYLYSGLGETPMPNIIAPSVAGYPGEMIVPYDVEKAKALLAEAGYPNGFEMTLMATETYNRGTEMGEIIKEQLEEVGIKANLLVVERAVFNAGLGGLTPEEFNKNFGWDMFIMGSGGSVDADTVLSRIMHTAPTNINNYGFYSNAEVDALLEKGAVTLDETERNACYKRIAEITLFEDPFGCYMNLRNNVYALSDKIVDFGVSPSNTMALNKIKCLAD